MNSDTELQQAYDEVLKKIGRNLILFQKAEQLIKHLMTLGNLKITSGQTTTYDDHASVWNKQTMGQLKNLFLEKHCTGKDHFAEPSSESDSDQASIAISFSFKGGAEAREMLFATLVEERNELVHHLFFKVDETSLDSCREIADYLDAQREKVLPAIKCLQYYCQSVTDGIQKMLSSITSEKARVELFLPEILQSPLVRNLATIAAAATDRDGWCILKQAIGQLDDFPRENIPGHLTQLGQKSLTALLQASRLFETRVEPTKGGKHHTLYRLSSTPPMVTRTSHPAAAAGGPP